MNSAKTILGFTSGWIVAGLLTSGCSSYSGNNSFEGYMSGQNYSYAVYDNEDLLTHDPIDDLHQRIKERETSGKPITDVFVISHGWNFTIDQSFRLYESYRASLNPLLDETKKEGADPAFEPYFIFVVWNSVTHPISDGVRSLLPFKPYDWVTTPLEYADEIAFHVPSAWGQSQHASRVALGWPTRWSKFESRLEERAIASAKAAEEAEAAKKGRTPELITSEYSLMRHHARKEADAGGFVGMRAPLSVILGELIRMRQKPGGARLHVVGHSFGAKVSAQATFDAISREVVRSLAPPVPPPDAKEDEGRPTPLVDSLVLIEPAMSLSELYVDVPLTLDEPQLAEARRRNLLRESPDDSASSDLHLRFPRVAERVETKVLAYSEEDAATGWLFAIGDVLIDNDSISRAQRIMSGKAAYVEYYYGVDNAKDSTVDPLDQTSSINEHFPGNVIPGLIHTVARVSYVVGSTVWSDVANLLVAPVAFFESKNADTSYRPLHYRIPAWIASVPLSPILQQRALGNDGFNGIVSPDSFSVLNTRLDISSWLDRDSIEYLAGFKPIRGKEFIALSERQVNPTTPPDDRTARFIVADASQVYNGAIADFPQLGAWLNITPGLAHDDVRDTQLMNGKDEHSHRKRDRSFYFVYNVTRGGNHYFNKMEGE